VLFRRTAVDTPEKLQDIVSRTAGELSEFTEESSPRRHVAGQVFTSTDYPKEYPIQFHSEYSYAARWPMKLYFCCFRPSVVGGETPFSDTRQVLAKMRKETREAFEKKGVMYIRNYRPHIGVSWQTAFRTQEREVVEKMCADARITCEWKEGGVLRTRARTEAIVSHPQSGEPVWFNHAFFFNVRAIEPVSVRRELLSYPELDPLSMNTTFGDGSTIEAEIIEEIRQLYDGASTRFVWEPGDILLLDNMLCAHARAPYQGARNIVVVMADAIARGAVEMSAN
jgi:hypothetical protein